MTRRGILFLCVENASRSQIAEGLARSLLPGTIAVFSAGSAPAAGVHPLAVEVMREAGIDLSSHRCKPIEAVDPDRVDTVVTLCAEQVCPVFPGKVERLHWPLPDPARAEGTREDRLTAFRAVRDALRERIQSTFIEIT